MREAANAVDAAGDVVAGTRAGGLEAQEALVVAVVEAAVVGVVAMV